MIDVRKMDVIPKVFQYLAKSRWLQQTKIGDKDEGDDCSISFLNYDFSLGENLQNELANLIFYFDVHRRALKENDRLAALFAIISAGDLAQKLSDFFDGLKEVVLSVMHRDPRFAWPFVPEEYQIPQHLLTTAADALKCMADSDNAANRDMLMLWKSPAGKIEVIEKHSVDVIQRTFVELAESIGVSREEMDNNINENDQIEWCIEYRYSLGEQLEKDFGRFLFSFEVLRLAILKNDQSAAYVALLDCRLYSHDISNLFLNIKDEVDKVTVLDKRFSWPVIPNGYQLPEHFAINPQR